MKKLFSVLFLACMMFLVSDAMAQCPYAAAKAAAAEDGQTKAVKVSEDGTVKKSCASTCAKKAAAAKAEAEGTDGVAVVKASANGAATPAGKTCTKSASTCAKKAAAAAAAKGDGTDGVAVVKASANGAAAPAAKKSCAKSCAKTCAKKAAVAKTDGTDGVAVVKASANGAATPAGKTCTKSASTCAKKAAAAAAAKGDGTDGVAVVKASANGAAAPAAKKSCAKSCAKTCAKKAAAAAAVLDSAKPVEDMTNPTPDVKVVKAAAETDADPTVAPAVETTEEGGSKQ